MQLKHFFDPFQLPPKQWRHACLPLWFAFLIALNAMHAHAASADSVRLDLSKRSLAVISNKLFKLTLSRPAGQVVGIAYGGRANLMAELPPGVPWRGSDPGDNGATSGPPGGALGDRGYFDAHWGPDSEYDRFICTSMKIITNTEDRVTLSFRRAWIGNEKLLPVNIDIRYSVTKGAPSFYSYIALDHNASMPAAAIEELRFVLKLNPQHFVYSAVTRDRQRLMPEFGDRSKERSEPTLIPEARRLINPRDSQFKLSFDDKYHYLSQNQFQLMYGWVTNGSTKVGLWAINPHKYEYAGGGPLKQDLTVQTGPYLLNMLHSGHLGTPAISLRANSNWKKVYGPFCIHLNQGNGSYSSLWRAAAPVSVKEYQSWPYYWASTNSLAKYYPIEGNRGTVKGRLVVSDPFFKASSLDLRQAWLGLGAKRRKAGYSYFHEVKYYQYWARPKQRKGLFRLQHVRPGTYTFYAFVPGVLGDFIYNQSVVVKRRKTVDLGDVVFRPARGGATLWDIGIADRSAAEFFVPPLNPLSPYPYPTSSPDRFRNYGSWAVFEKIYPKVDPIFTVGYSNYSKDWYFVHPVRRSGKKYVSVTFTIVFYLSTQLAKAKAKAKKASSNPSRVFALVKGTYVLHIAVASSTQAGLQVRVNDPLAEPLIDSASCKCAVVANDGGMARATDQGYYTLYSIPVSSSLLKSGANRFYLTQRRTGSFLYSIMYDYIRFDGPS